jgi:heme-degrading monooxygenase HmoA
VAAPGLLDHELFESIYNPGKLTLLAAWKDAATGASWQPSSIARLRHRRVRVIRDYGMFDRREAAQYYPPLESKSAPARSEQNRGRHAGRA